MSFHEGSKWQEMQEDNAKKSKTTKSKIAKIKDMSYIELMLEITKWSEKYQFSFQFWGKGNNNVFIQKDFIDLYEFGGEESPKSITIKALEWVYKVNNVK